VASQAPYSQSADACPDGTDKKSGTFKERDALIRDMLADDKLGQLAARVGAAIAMAIRVETGSRDLSYSDIAKLAGVSDRAVKAAVPELEARGWLIKSREAGPKNNYRMVHKSHQLSGVEDDKVVHKSHPQKGVGGEQIAPPLVNKSHPPLYSKSSEVNNSEESDASKHEVVPVV
jgi:hypothetical protein